jgi:hypothetical protein
MSTSQNTALQTQVVTDKYLTPIQVLRVAMATCGMTDRSLSAASGVHLSLIRRYLGIYASAQARPTVVGPRNARRLALALGVSAEDLLYGTRPA